MLPPHELLHLAQILVDEHGEDALWQARWRAAAHTRRGNSEAARMWRRIERAARGIIKRRRGEMITAAGFVAFAHSQAATQIPDVSRPLTL